jgi:hypothetical protein
MASKENNNREKQFSCAQFGMKTKKERKGKIEGNWCYNS